MHCLVKILRVAFPFAFTAAVLLTVPPGCQSKPSLKQDQAEISLDTLYETFLQDSIYTPLISLDTLYKYYDTLHLERDIYFFYQGDLLMDATTFQRRLSEEIMRSHLEQQQVKFFKPKQDVFIGYDEATNDTVKWDKFPIRFCIRKSSFSSVPSGYEALRSNLLQAMANWSGVCNVKFDYVEAADIAANHRPFNLDFIVQMENPGRPVWEAAAAFFPNTPPALRVLRIMPLYWSTPKDKVGILRHEIGHILGFLHEHAARVDLAPLECRQYYPETVLPGKPVIVEYDAMSVMHYFCGGAGTMEMSFSKNDSLGFAAIYGKNQN